MRILITGSEGYLGRHLIKKMPPETEILTLDILTGQDIRESLSKYRYFKPEFIFHLAAQTSVQNSFKIPHIDFSHNVMGTLNLLKLGGKVIFTSTAAVYGDKLNAKEIDPPCPQSPYAMSKLMAEQHIIYSGLPYMILRIGNVYGKDNPRGVIKALKEGGKIFGDGTHQRDYVYIDDAIDAIWESREWEDGIYNIGTGIATSVNKIAMLIDVGSKYGKAVKEQNYISLDVSKAKKAGWQPKCQLKDFYDK